MADDLTHILADVGQGEPTAIDRLAEAVYARLRDMARQRLEREFGRGLPGLTIQPTVLADDTLMRLIRQRQQFDNAGHFFAIASREMRRVLLDYCRQRKAQKRGAVAVRVSIASDSETPTDARDVDYELLDGALERLSQLDPRKADIVKYRVLWSLTVQETAEALGVGVSTVERDWRFAKAWLAAELTDAA